MSSFEVFLQRSHTAVIFLDLLAAGGFIFSDGAMAWEAVSQPPFSLPTWIPENDHDQVRSEQRFEKGAKSKDLQSSWVKSKCGCVLPPIHARACSTSLSADAKAQAIKERLLPVNIFPTGVLLLSSVPTVGSYVICL